MAGDWEFEVLDYPKELLRTDYKDFFRVYVAPGVLKALALEKGDPCVLTSSGNPVGNVLVWEYNKNSKMRELHISKHLQSVYGVNRGTKVSLLKIHDQLPSAMNVTLCEITAFDSKGALPKIPEEELNHWAWQLEYNLYRAEHIAPGEIFEGVEAHGQKRSFKILQVNDSCSASPHRFQQLCKVKVTYEENWYKINASHISDQTLVVPTDGIGGLEAQVTKLNKSIGGFGNSKSELTISSSLPEWENGILLHGPSGTGKSLLLTKVGEAGWRGVFDLGAELRKYPSTAGKALTAMKDIFTSAKKCQPSIILLDKLERFAADHTAPSAAQDIDFIDALCHELEQLRSSRTLVLATTRSLANVSPELRGVRTFSQAIEIPVPNSRSRISILKALNNLTPNATNELLENIASRTHGFVGADLALLSYVAAKEARDRISVIENARISVSSIEQVTEQDFDVALLEVKPTAIREAFIEIQETRWDDIGGHEEVKEILRHALISPTKVSYLRSLSISDADFAKYGEYFKTQAVTPGKGLLLYGPPGCSKTMTARAAATESGYNFIAVKGAELLNMYVGESERKIREIFGLARAVSPSILFFDEIDAVGTARSDSQHSGLNIVTTLLNELDGIIKLTDVFVLAATNRPDVIDSALTRAGRFDKMVYVGPPDLEARKSILSKQVRKMKIEEDLDLEVLAQETDGFSGAELIKICNDAGMAAITEVVSKSTEGAERSPVASRKHFDEALNGVEKAITSEMLEFFEEFRLKHSSRYGKKIK